MKLKIGDVFWLMVTNPRTDESERRPVVIFAFEDGNPLIASFATITTSKIEDFDGRFDKWKSPVFDLPSSSGLEKSSYVKANCLASVDKSVFTSKDYLGELNRNDLRSAILKIGEFINSDEEAW